MNRTKQLIDRREALKRTALLMGGVVSAPAILGILQGCRARPRLDWKPAFLSDEQARIVTAVADIIIPRTDTPGAADVGVPAFIDSMLDEVYPAEDRERFLAGLDAFASECAAAQGRPFLDLDAAAQAAFTKTVHDRAVGRTRGPKGSAPGAPADAFMMTTKELTLLGFFTSEPGATEVLQYEPVPGVLRSCIPLSEAGNGKTWATS